MKHLSYQSPSFGKIEYPEILEDAEKVKMYRIDTEAIS